MINFVDNNFSQEYNLAASNILSKVMFRLQENISSMVSHFLQKPCFACRKIFLQWYHISFKSHVSPAGKYFFNGITWFTFSSKAMFRLQENISSMVSHFLQKPCFACRKIFLQWYHIFFNSHVSPAGKYFFNGITFSMIWLHSTWLPRENCYFKIILLSNGQPQNVTLNNEFRISLSKGVLIFDCCVRHIHSDVN